MKTRTTLSFAAGLLLATTATAQLADGLNGSSYNGIWGLDRQPASISLSRNRMEVNLFHFLADVDNTYLHLEGEGSFGLFNFDNMLRVNADDDQLAQRLNEERSITASARILGPSVAFRVGDHNSFAITTGARAVSYSTELDGLTRLLGADTLTYNPGEARPLNELRFRTAAMAWGEVGASAARRFDLGQRLRLHIGLTGKVLLGSAGIYARNEAAVLGAANDGAQVVSGVDLAYGMSDLDAITTMDGPGDLMQGFGIGGDAGLVLEWDRKATAAQDSAGVAQSKYLVRLGLSVTDLGAIRFAGGGRHRITDGSADVEAIGALDVADIASLEGGLSDLFLKDPDASRQADQLRMALPTMVHASLDVNPWGCLFVNMNASLGLDRGLAGVVNPSSISITPRVETRHFELGLPVSLHQLQGMRMGIAVRLGPLMVGSDKLGGLMGLTDVGGMDVYAGLKVNLGRR